MSRKFFQPKTIFLATTPIKVQTDAPRLRKQLNEERLANDELRRRNKRLAKWLMISFCIIWLLVGSLAAKWSF